MTDADSTHTAPAGPAYPADPARPENADPGEGIRDRSVREVVERTRDVIRKTRELLDSSRDLLDRVRHRDDDGGKTDAEKLDDDDTPGEHDADEGSGSHAGTDAWPVDGRA